MVVGSPPFEMSEQTRRPLRRRPGPPDQPSHALSDRQVHPFDKGRVELAREPELLESCLELFPGAQEHLVARSHQAPSSIDLLDLTVDQPHVHLPLESLMSNRLDPGTKVRGQGVEVEVQPIAGKDGQTS